MNRQTIQLIISLLVFVGLLVFLTSPTYQKLKLAQAELVRQQQELERTQNLVSVLDQLSSQFSSLSSDLEKVELSIPKKEDTPKLLVELPTLASQNGLVVSEIGFGDPTKREGYSSIPIRLSAKGSYLNLKSFLKAVEQNLRLLDVVSIGFGEDKGGQYDFGFSINTYYQ